MYCVQFEHAHLVLGIFIDQVCGRILVLLSWTDNRQVATGRDVSEQASHISIPLVSEKRSANQAKVHISY